MYTFSRYLGVSSVNLVIAQLIGSELCIGCFLFCFVLKILATGLSGLYSSLPKKLVPRYGLCQNHNGDISLNSPGGPVSVTTPIYIQSDLLNPCLLELQVGGAEWHQITENECSNSIDIRRFLHTLHFCNLTIKVRKMYAFSSLFFTNIFKTFSNVYAYCIDGLDFITQAFLFHARHDPDRIIL